MSHTIKQMHKWCLRAIMLTGGSFIVACHGGGSGGGEGEAYVDEGVIVTPEEAAQPGFSSDASPESSLGSSGATGGKESDAASITSLLPPGVSEADVEMVGATGAYPRIAYMRLVSTGQDMWQVQGSVELADGLSYELVGSVELMSRMQSGENTLGLYWEGQTTLQEGQATLDIREMNLRFTAVNDPAGMREARISLAEGYGGAALRYKKSGSWWEGGSAEQMESCSAALDQGHMILRFRLPAKVDMRHIKRVKLR